MKKKNMILLLGHKGMLGNAVHKYFQSLPSYGLVTTEERYGTQEFIDVIKGVNADVIINCIGSIPQKKPTEEMYAKVNIELPLLLDTIGPRVIHPSTDCEFSGQLEVNFRYAKDAERDASDPYGKSKASASALLETNSKHTKIIRTSVIGHELHTHLSLLDWFLSQEGESVRGYTNHYWNGITTLQWAKLCEEVIENWDDMPTLSQFGTEIIHSKYDLLHIASKVYGKTINIEPFATTESCNKALAGDREVPSLREQLIELKAFYNK